MLKFDRINQLILHADQTINNIIQPYLSGAPEFLVGFVLLDL
jgi:hypothetical protein